MSRLTKYLRHRYDNPFVKQRVLVYIPDDILWELSMDFIDEIWDIYNSETIHIRNEIELDNYNLNNFRFLDLEYLL